jgi:hypothetical protein
MKTPLKIQGIARVKAQFLQAGIAIVAGVLNVVSKMTINRADSQFKGDEMATVTIGSSKPFQVLVADIRGAYSDWYDRLKDKAKAEPLWVDANGKKVPENAFDGYINPKLQFKVDNGTLLIAV